MTFTEHSAAVSTVVFSSSDKVVVSASLDGTVRAFDLHRYIGVYIHCIVHIHACTYTDYTVHVHVHVHESIHVYTK